MISLTKNMRNFELYMLTKTSYMSCMIKELITNEQKQRLSVSLYCNATIVQQRILGVLNTTPTTQAHHDANGKLETSLTKSVDQKCIKRYMGHNPKEIMKKITPVQMTKQRNHHSLVDHENLAHLLPSIKLMIIARKDSHIQYNHTTKRVSQI